MMEAANAAGLKEAAVFAIAMYCVQGFAGYPLTAVCLQLEGKKLLKEYRNGGVSVVGVSNEVDAVNGKLETTESPRKKLLPPTPAKWNSVVVMLGKLGFVAWLATQLGSCLLYTSHQGQTALIVQRIGQGVDDGGGQNLVAGNIFADGLFIYRHAVGIQVLP